MQQTYRIRISLRKLLRAVSIGFAAIGAGRGIYSAFGDGAYLQQVSGDKEDC